MFRVPPTNILPRKHIQANRLINSVSNEKIDDKDKIETIKKVRYETIRITVSSFRRILRNMVKINL